MSYLGKEVRTLDVDGKGPVKVSLGGVLEVLHRKQTSIGNEHVNLGICIHSLLDKRLYAINCASISTHEACLAYAELLNLGEDHLGGLLVGRIVDDDVCTKTR